MALIEDYQQQRLIGSLSDDIFLSITQRDGSGGGSHRQTLGYVSLISYWPVFLLRRVFIRQSGADDENDETRRARGAFCFVILPLHLPFPVSIVQMHLPLI